MAETLVSCHVLILPIRFFEDKRCSFAVISFSFCHPVFNNSWLTRVISVFCVKIQRQSSQSPPICTCTTVILRTTYTRAEVKFNKLNKVEQYLEYFLKSVSNLSGQIVQEEPKTETQLLQMIGRKTDLLHKTRIE